MYIELQITHKVQYTVDIYGFEQCHYELAEQKTHLSPIPY